MHTIRLRGPWNYQPLARTTWTPTGTSLPTEEDVPAGGRLNIPSSWEPVLGENFFGQVRFQRYFHSPTGLTEQDQVFIRIDEVDALASVYLNDQPLGDIPPGAGPTRFDVTILLQQRNQLEIVVDLPMLLSDSAPLQRAGSPEQAGGLTGEVAIEIHSPN